MFGNLTNSIDVYKILTSDELSVMKEISEKVLSGFYSQLEFEQPLSEQTNTSKEKTDITQLVNVSENDKIHQSDTYPTITCEWSESSAFEDGKTYTVAEFDSIMKQADNEWIKQRQYEIDTYGNDIDKIYEAYEKGEIESVHQGYAKTKFNVNMPDRAVHTFRQDIGDGDGGIIDFLKQYPQYSEVVKVLENDISKNSNSEVSSNLPENEPISTDKTFAEQVDEALQPNNQNQYSALKVCDTPQILLDVGCQQLPMLYTQKHLREAIHPKSKDNIHWHGLTTEQIKKLPELLENPVMIFDSLSRNDSLVVCVLDTDEDNLPLIVSIKPNGIGTYELEKVDSNFITSVYGRSNFEKHIEQVVNQDKMLYCNKQKSQELFRVSGLQLPKCLNNLDFDIIIHRSRNIVNENIVEEKYTSEEQLSFDNMNPDSEKIANERTNQNEQKETQEKSEKNIGQSSESNLDARRMGKTSLGDSVSRIFESSERSSNQLYEQSSINSNEYFNNKESIIEFAESTFGNGENIKIFQPNYRITDNNIGAGTQGQRFQANISAITLLKQLESENRSATPDEQTVLAKYVGCGGLSEYFKESNPHYDELKNLLTEDEYNSARASTLDSFYTPPIIIDSIYTVLENSGFNGGNILEPAMGIGNFFGKIPDSISENSKLYGVEIDSISGRIAKRFILMRILLLMVLRKLAFKIIVLMLF